ncbi:MAG TPA: DUF4136 domain-containing protein [Bacteroidales bacterium]|nr:DUF4136 domain-containing protein [Bacteroidales bacterium]
MKIIKYLLFIAGAIVILFSSCSKYPSTSSRLLEDLAVYTQYDLKADFNSYKTFAIVDSIAYRSDDDSGFVLNANAQAVLTRITENMQQLGYTLVPHTANPDLAINVAVFEVTNTYAYSYYPGWYWGWYYPPNYWGGWYGYGYYYGYYPVYYTSYSSGTLMIDMADYKHPDTVAQKIPIVWNAYIRGLLTGNHTISDINSSIDQAFDQTKPFQK